jgi:tripartite-type tricarboxylate transporter receptor subunit TctC
MGKSREAGEDPRGLIGTWMRMANIRSCSALALVVTAFATAIPATAAAADAYPTKPIRFLVPYPPGGSTDPIVRVIGQHLSETWGQQVVVDNRGGAGGNLANETVAKAPPDGYTLLLGTVSTISINPSLYAKLPFDPVKDLQAVSLVVSGFYLLATNPAFPATSVKELVAVAKSKPGQINYASGGAGSAPHLAMELLKQMAGINVAHIPYKGTGPALTDVVAGHVPMLFGSAVSVLPLAKAGRVKVLAMTGRQRSKAMPDIPTIAEAGYPGFEVDSWYGVLVPARTPRPIVAALHKEIARTVDSPDVRSRFAALGLDPVGNTPEEFAQIIRQDLARWAKVVKGGGIRID